MNRHETRPNFIADRQRSIFGEKSIFVGNISYEVTEEQLREVFSKVGTVVHLRLVHDRDTGKPKGYGFCEFTEVKSAELAIRNLNGYELNGRNLRVDSAAGENKGGEDGNAGTSVANDSPYGDDCDPARAPEVISRAVASLPPEKLFQLMKQMKDAVVANPSETRNMLVSNPQLAYALLQAQVVMRIVDPQAAMTMLHRDVPSGATSSAPFHQPLSGSANAFSTPGRGGSGDGFGRGAAPPAYGAPPSGPPGYGAPPDRELEKNSVVEGAPAAAAQPTDLSQSDAENAQLLVAVMNLTEAEISQLPPEDRLKVLALRNQLRNV